MTAPAATPYRVTIGNAAPVTVMVDDGSGYLHLNRLAQALAEGPEGSPLMTLEMENQDPGGVTDSAVYRDPNVTIDI